MSTSALIALVAFIGAFICFVLASVLSRRTDPSPAPYAFTLVSIGLTLLTVGLGFALLPALR